MHNQTTNSQSPDQISPVPQSAHYGHNEVTDILSSDGDLTAGISEYDDQIIEPEAIDPVPSSAGTGLAARAARAYQSTMSAHSSSRQGSHIDAWDDDAPAFTQTNQHSAFTASDSNSDHSWSHHAASAHGYGHARDNESAQGNARNNESVRDHRHLDENDSEASHEFYQDDSGLASQTYGAASSDHPVSADSSASASGADQAVIASGADHSSSVSSEVSSASAEDSASSARADHFDSRMTLRNENAPSSGSDSIERDQEYGAGAAVSAEAAEAEEQADAPAAGIYALSNDSGTSASDAGNEHLAAAVAAPGAVSRADNAVAQPAADLQKSYEYLCSDAQGSGNDSDYESDDDKAETGHLDAGVGGDKQQKFFDSGISPVSSAGQEVQSDARSSKINQQPESGGSQSIRHGESNFMSEEQTAVRQDQAQPDTSGAAADTASPQGAAGSAPQGNWASPPGGATVPPYPWGARPPVQGMYQAPGQGQMPQSMVPPGMPQSAQPGMPPGMMPGMPFPPGFYGMPGPQGSQMRFAPWPYPPQMAMAMGMPYGQPHPGTGAHGSASQGAGAQAAPVKGNGHDNAAPGDAAHLADDNASAKSRGATGAQGAIEQAQSMAQSMAHAPGQTAPQTQVHAYANSHAQPEHRAAVSAPFNGSDQPHGSQGQTVSDYSQHPGMPGRDELALGPGAHTGAYNAVGAAAVAPGPAGTVRVTVSPGNGSGRGPGNYAGNGNATGAGGAGGAGGGNGGQGRGLWGQDDWNTGGSVTSNNAHDGEKWFENLAVHIFMVAIISLLLLIPSIFFENVLSDRQYTENSAIESITTPWGGSQLVSDPQLYIAATVEKRTVNTYEEDGELYTRQTRSQALSEWYFISDFAHSSSTLTSEVRKRGNYEALLYKVRVEQQGSFDLAHIADRLNTIESDVSVRKADIKLYFGVLDTGGIDEVHYVNVNGRDFPAQPSARDSGFCISLSSQDISDIMSARPLGESSPTDGRPALYNTLDADAERAREDNTAAAHAGRAESSSYRLLRPGQIEYRAAFTLRGSQQFKYQPLGVESTTAISGSGIVPSFQGRFLPSEHSVDEQNRTFEALYRLSSLATGTADHLKVEKFRLSESSGYVVSLADRSMSYTLIERLTKYVLLFIAMTFVTVLAFEIVSRRTVSLVQYVVVGSALILFYMVLLSMSEHFSFTVSYVTAAVLMSGMIALYLKAVLNSIRSAACILLMLLAMYSVLFAIVHIQAYALLVGTILLVVMLGVIMYITRRINHKGSSLLSQYAQGTGTIMARAAAAAAAPAAAPAGASSDSGKSWSNARPRTAPVSVPAAAPFQSQTHEQHADAPDAAAAAAASGRAAVEAEAAAATADDRDNAAGSDSATGNSGK